MILLDTNIVSALMRLAIDARIDAWLGGLSDEIFAASTITCMEIRYGIERLPDGKRRKDLAERFEMLIAQGEGLALVSFDESAARLAGGFLARREAQGRRASTADMMIAGVAAANGAALATWNGRDFEGLGLQLIAP